METTSTPVFIEHYWDNQPLKRSMNPDGPDISPPAYSSTTPRPLPVTNEAQSRTGSTANFLPCVVPQTTKSFRGAFASPFIRGYARDLEAFNIPCELFLEFIDGLNEAWLGHPTFTGASAVGGVMSMVHGVHPVQLAGVGLQVGAGLAGAGTSYFRTKRYMQKVNESLFESVGLHANIMNTKDMMAKVGYPGDVLTLPPLDRVEDMNIADQGHSSTTTASLTQEDPRIRRMKALEAYVMPLDLNIPQEISAVDPSNPWSKMAAFNAQRNMKKQEKKLMKTRSEEEKDAKENEKEQKKEQKEFNKKMAEIDKDLEKAHKKYRKEVVKEPEKARGELDKEVGKLDKERAKREAKLTKELGKLSSEAQGKKDKADRKEQKKSQKIRWIVISELKPGDNSDQDLPSTEEE